MTGSDIIQDKKIQFVFSAIMVLSALTGILLYQDRKKHIKLQQEISELDKKIKTMQINKMNGTS